MSPSLPLSWRCSPAPPPNLPTELWQVAPDAKGQADRANRIAPRIAPFCSSPG